MSESIDPLRDLISKGFKPLREGGELSESKATLSAESDIGGPEQFVGWDRKGDLATHLRELLC